jgi:hypothetical protein
VPIVVPPIAGVCCAFYPWYGFGFGYPYYGYGYGYGAWYDPFSPWGYGYGGYGAYGTPGTEDQAYGAGPGRNHPTGAIRLKVSPDTAQVYIDGALVGAAGDFDGLVSHHLVLEVGTHLLELHAPGYETYSGKLKVEAGNTLTERVSMKKSK